jgi:hypothetical protein
MPMRLGRAPLLALIGGVATFVSWPIVLANFAKPHWPVINYYSVRLNEFDGIALLLFGPIVVAVIFFATICLEAWLEKKRFEDGRPPPGNRWRIFLFGALPAAASCLLVIGPFGDPWYFPLCEAAVFVVGLGLGVLWARWRRTDEGILIAAP